MIVAGELCWACVTQRQKDELKTVCFWFSMVVFGEFVGAFFLPSCIGAALESVDMRVSNITEYCPLDSWWKVICRMLVCIEFSNL